MKILFPVAALFLLSSCSKQFMTVTIKKDCTGTYIRTGEKDYEVFNDEILKDRKNDESMELRYEKVADSKCRDKEGIRCMMYHPSEGCVIIKQLK